MPNSTIRPAHSMISASSPRPCGSSSRAASRPVAMLITWITAVAAKETETSFTPSLPSRPVSAGGCPTRHDRGKRLAQACHVVREAPALDDLQAALAHRRQSLRILEQAAQHPGEIVDVVGAEDGAVLPGMDEVGAGADPVADHHRAPGAHHLVDHEAPRFLHRRQNECIAQVVAARQVALLLEAKEAPGPRGGRRAGRSK